MMNKLTIFYKAQVGDTVDVRNYRRRGLYENATVNDITVRIYGKGSKREYHVRYDVTLTRKSKTCKPLTLYVGEAYIEFLHK